MNFPACSFFLASEKLLYVGQTAVEITARMTKHALVISNPNPGRKWPVKFSEVVIGCGVKI
jgi:hypothetical protein